MEPEPLGNIALPNDSNYISPVQCVSQNENDSINAHLRTILGPAEEHTENIFTKKHSEVTSDATRFIKTYAFHCHSRREKFPGEHEIMADTESRLAFQNGIEVQRNVFSPVPITHTTGFEIFCTSRRILGDDEMREKRFA